MKSLIEAGIAILIVYLFFEWQKQNQLASSGTVGQSGAAGLGGAAGASGSGGGGGCGCSGASKIPTLTGPTLGNTYDPLNNFPGAIISPYNGDDVPPSPAPVPRPSFQASFSSN